MVVSLVPRRRQRAADPGPARPAGRTGAGRRRSAPASGLPRSTTYRLLGVLVEHGFVSYLPEERRYGLGVVDLRAGLDATRGRCRCGGSPSRCCSRLVGTVHQHAHLAVLHGPDVYYVIEERAPGRPPLVTDVGVRLPATADRLRAGHPVALPPRQLRALFPTAADAGPARRPRSAHARPSCGSCWCRPAGTGTPRRSTWSPPGLASVGLAGHRPHRASGRRHLGDLRLRQSSRG